LEGLEDIHKVDMEIHFLPIIYQDEQYLMCRETAIKSTFTDLRVLLLDLPVLSPNTFSLIRVWFCADSARCTTVRVIIT